MEKGGSFFLEFEPSVIGVVDCVVDLDQSVEAA